MKLRLFLLTLFVCVAATVAVQAQTIRYVKPAATGTGTGASWDNASGSIQDMINASTAGDEVRIAGGTYLLTATLTMKNGVNIYGGFTDANSRPKSDLDANGTVEAWEFTNPTVLDGQNNLPVLYSAKNAITTLYDGLTITNGLNEVNGGYTGNDNHYKSGGGAFILTNGKLSNCIVRNNACTATRSDDTFGGGIYISGGSVTDCLVENNTSSYQGGGIYVYNNGEVTHCVIRGNTTTQTGGGGGGIYAYSGSVSDCLIENNTASYRGGGISGGEVTRCIIRGNSVSNGDGGGTNGGIISECLIENNTVPDSYYYSGGGAYRGTITHSVIRGNQGGGLAATTTNNCLIVNNKGSYAANSGTYVNCTFASNEGYFYGTATNCIIWGNTIYVDDYYSSDITYSAVSGSYAGKGNISLSGDNGPLFVDPEAGDYRLQPCSPLVNAGSTSALAAGDLLDLAGNTRTVEDSVDMGAYEQQALGGTPVKPVITLDGTTLVSSNAANYQWYFGGQPIEGATAQSCEITQTGYYSVRVFSTSGCYNESLPLLATVESTPVAQGKEYPQYFYFNSFETQADTVGWTGAVWSQRAGTTSSDDHSPDGQRYIWTRQSYVYSPVFDLSTMENPEVIFSANLNTYEGLSVSYDGINFEEVVKNMSNGLYTCPISPDVKQIRFRPPVSSIYLDAFCIREKPDKAPSTRHIVYSFSHPEIPEGITGDRLAIDTGNDMLSFGTLLLSDINVSDMLDPVLRFQTATVRAYDTLTVKIVAGNNVLERKISLYYNSSTSYMNIVSLRLPSNTTQISITASSSAALPYLHIAELSAFTTVSPPTPLTVNHFITEGRQRINWTHNKGVWTLEGTPEAANSVAKLWLPMLPTTAANSYFSVDIQNPNPEKMQLYLNNQLISGSGNVMYTIGAGRQYFIKAVSVDNTPVNVVLKNLQLSSGSPSRFPTDKRLWYREIETDSCMQFISEQTKYRQPNGNSNYYSYYKFIGTNGAEYEYDYNYPQHINNDDDMDFYGLYTKDYTYYANLYVADGNGGTKIVPFGTQPETFTPCDYNSDGLTDFMAGETMYVQGADGTFANHRLTIISREQLEAGYAQEQLPSIFNPGTFRTLWIEPQTGKYVQPQGAQIMDMDVNGDGLTDLINNISGELLYNVGNDVYVRQQMGGLMLFRDLTGDGLPDYIISNSTAKTVTAYIRNIDGTTQPHLLMSNMSMDTQMWAYDIDHDGDVDVILPFSYSSSNGMSFLAVMVNNGQGSFTMTENAYAQQLKFVDCADVDGDGFYDILAINNSTSAVWLKGDAQQQFALQTQPLYLINSSSIDNFTVADVTGDNKLDLIYRSRNYGGIQPIAIATETAAPNKPAMPEFAFEPATGNLKINWQPATDPSYSSADLTYELRIGTAPNKGDIYYANAYADGRRRNLMEGNMGYALTKIVDAAGWSTGNYYISIQAINPAKRGSVFSDAALFTKTHPTAEFTLLSDNANTTDTLSVMLMGANGRDAALRYLWNFDGGTLVGSNSDSTVLKLKYTLPGQKKITLQTRNAAGDMSPVCERETFVAANKFSLAFSYTPSDVGIGAYADLDNCGKLEALTDNGIYQNDGQGNFSKVSKIFNTNFEATVVNFDYNNDGLVDIFAPADYSTDAQVYKNSSTAGNIIFPMTGEELDIYGTPQWDLNNDGKVTVINASFDYDAVIDLNNDGYVDFIAYENYPSPVVTIYLNDGGQYVTTKTIDFGGNDYRFVHNFVDINSDGFIDLMAGSGNKIYIHLNRQNESFDPVNEITLPLPEKASYFGFCGAYDFDNNGYLDLCLKIQNYDYNREQNYYAFCVLYFYEGLQSSFSELYKVWDSYLTPNMWADMDGDGVQDLTYGARFTLKNSTAVTNTLPATPANIRWTQTDGTLLIEWDAATDAESSAGMLRYNISVKKKGATGDNAFVISPLNNLTNGVPPVSVPGYPYNPYYRTATRMEIPLTALAANTEYEIQIQTLDGWNAVSDFSAPVTAMVKETPLIAVPVSVCAATPAFIEYKGTAAPAELVWNWDGGELTGIAGNFYQVVWSTPGTKNISVTADGITGEASLQVMEAINTAFNLPDETLAGVSFNVQLQNRQSEYTIEWFYSTDAFVYSYPDMYEVPAGTAPVWNVNSGSNTASLTFPKEGYYTVRFGITAPCGTVQSAWYEVRVTSIGTPEITIVTINGNKNEIAWAVPANLSTLVTGVNVYKEIAKYGNYQLVANVPVSPSSYIDPLSNTSVMASRYRIAWTTSQGGESQLSIPHKGIHLMINKGAGSGWNLFWGQYEGAIIESFRIMHGTAPDNLSLLIEVPGNIASYTDLTPPDGTVYYAIEYSKVYNNGAKEDVLPEGRSNTVCTEEAFNVIPATGITISSRDKLTPSQPSTTLAAYITPLAATCQTVNWTIESGNELVTLAPNGLLSITGIGNGDVVVKAATIDGSGLSIQKTIQVREVVTAATGVLLNKNMLTLTVNATEQLNATVQPVYATNQNVTWSSSDNAIATVSNTGLVTAVSAGTAVITVTTDDGGYTAQCVVTVVVPVTGVSLSKNETTLAVNATEQLTATVLPTDATNQNITWESSNTAIVTVSSTGLITAITEGTATVTATTEEGGFTAQCEVTAIIPVTGLLLSKNETTLAVSATEQLTATVEPNNATNQNVTWESSNTAIATVSSTGLVTAVSAGTATITATTEEGGYTAQCVVTAVVPVTGLSLSKNTTTLAVNATEQLTATVLPTDATNQNVTWESSNTAIATVSSTGLVTAVSAGVATITVTTEEGGYTAQCEVTAAVIAVTGVSLNKNATLLPVNGTEQLTATVEPVNATNQNVIWESSNSTIATVSNTGLITALSAGTAVITVTTEDGGYTAQCEVTAVIPVTGISLSKNATILPVNGTEQLTATVEPANATNQNVTWESSNSTIATVSNNGWVTAIAKGEAIMTVTTDDGNFTATCTVTVTQPVTGVTLNKTELSLKVNNTEMLVATVLPDDASNQTVVWSSNTPEVAIVDETGLVTAIAKGEAIITVTTEEGGFTANCAVTVTDGSDITGNTFANITVYGNKNNVCIVNNSGVVLKSVQITDVLGRVVYNGRASSSVTIPVNGTSGIYVVKLISDDNKVLSTKVHLTI